MNLSTAGVDWRLYKPLMKCDDLATIYPYSILTIKKMAQQRNPKIPTPCAVRPFLFRREDVKRHFERLSA